jgi:hypothetical protein
VTRSSGAATAAIALGSAAVALACAGGSRPRVGPVAPEPLRDERPAFASWRYHPRTAAPMTALLPLGGQGMLWAGKRGERWLYDGATSRLVAALPAPEDLVAVTRDGAGGHWFVGRTGTSYHALTPLGTFTEATVPLVPLSQVSASGQTLLGVGGDRRLWRSTDDGRAWTSVGPSDTWFVDVALDAHGHALALASPEKLFESEDGGATFRASELPPSGALSVVSEPSGDGIRVVSLLGSRRVGGSESVSAQPPPLLEELLKKGVRLPLGEDAGMLAEHSAELGPGGYLELRALGEGKREWELLSGKLGEPLAARPLPEAKGCGAVRLGRFERHVFFACFRATPSATQRVELYASTDGGGSFARVAPDFWARVARFRLAVGRDGALVIAGACPPSSEGPGCSPAGILYRRAVADGRDRDGGAEGPSGFELAVGAVPSLPEGSTIELTFDPKGKTLFALGPSTKGSTLTLFVSRDGGQSFEPHDLGEATRDQDIDAGVPFTPGPDGTLALVLGGRRGAATLVVVDVDGRVLHAGQPPERALLGAAGLSALAVGPDTGVVLESLDGGVSWEARGKLPAAPCPGDPSCDVPIACSSEGCVVGSEFTRVAWGRSDAPSLEAYQPVESAGETGYERRLRTPLACTLGPAPWHVLAGVSELPDADQLAIGDAAWFALAEERSSGAVRMLHGRSGPHPRVDVVELLPPLPRPSEYAQSVSSQIEGAAAVRYRIPASRSGDTRLRDVEVAWDNLFEGSVRRARLADGGLYTPGDFERASAGPETARPDLVSIAERGLYLRLHVRTRAEQPTLFLDGTSVATIPPFSWPAAIPRSGHGEMAHLGTSHVGLMLLSRAGAIARARLVGKNWVFDGASVGLPDPEAFDTAQIVNITYLAGQAALHVEELDQHGRRSEAHVFPLNAEGSVTGTPIAVPTELDLAATPRACSTAERASSARLVARGYPGTHHPVVVSDAVEPPRAMLSGDAVLHGTREAACVAALSLHPAPGGLPDPATTESGAVLLDDPAHAWLFRRSRDGEGVRVDYRAMSCRFEPNLELPDEILSAPEALAPKR